MSKKNFIFIFIFFPFAFFGQESSLLRLKFQEDYSPTYDEVIEMYRKLDKAYPQAKLIEAGPTDCGKPLHTFVISKNKRFDPARICREGKIILLINIGIHPGEPEGIDASLMFADNILRNKDGMAQWLDNTVIVIIPVYNIGGALNRSAYNRSGQTTPYVTGLPRLGYDREKPFTADIRYYDTYKPTQWVDIPEYYVVPQAWKPVLERLALNKKESWNRVGIPIRSLPKTTGHNSSLSTTTHPGSKKPGNGTLLDEYFEYQKVRILNIRIMLQRISPV